MQIPVQLGRNGVPEWGLLELQGTLSSTKSTTLKNLHVGEITNTPQNGVMLVIGNHQMNGQRVQLHKPFLIFKKRSATQEAGTGASLQIEGVLREKLVFSSRPNPILKKSPDAKTGRDTDTDEDDTGEEEEEPPSKKSRFSVESPSWLQKQPRRVAPLSSVQLQQLRETFFSDLARINVSYGTENVQHTLEPSWAHFLNDEFDKPYFTKLLSRLAEDERQGSTIFPPAPSVFQAFRLCPWEKLKVVIIGQDPYHDVGQAMGMCFSVPKGVNIPSSLRNIFKELHKDQRGFVTPSHGDLSKWASQGVLLLNASLSVRAHEANSHANFGWQIFTDRIIRVINEQKKNVVFMLWGSFAQKKGGSISSRQHHVLKAAHPSGLSATRGFLGCKHFSQTNAFLKKVGKSRIDWNL